MKNLIQGVLCSLFLLIGVSSQAYVVGPVNPDNIPAIEKNDQLSVGEFLTLTPENYTAKTGKKMKWRHRMALKVVQKRMRKQMKKGKIKAEDASNGSNLISMLSMIFGISSILFILLSAAAAGGGGGAFGLLSLLFAITGFIMGIIGLKKEDSLAMALVGTITGGLMLLLFLLAIILVASFLF